MSTAVFCPYCADRMTERNGVLHCWRGRLECSRSLTDGLKTRFGEPAAKLDVTVGGRWYCPRCATAMVETGGDVACPRGCGVLNAFVRELVELHQHWIQC